MLNKLRCHTHFLFSAIQITWCRLLIQIHILNDKQCRSKSVGLKPTDLDLHCFQRQGISGFSRTRIKILEEHEKYLLLACTHSNDSDQLVYLHWPVFAWHFFFINFSLETLQRVNGKHWWPRCRSQCLASLFPIAGYLVSFYYYYVLWKFLYFMQTV